MLLLLLFIVLILLLSVVKTTNGYTCTSSSSTGVCGALKTIYANSGGSTWTAQCGFCTIFNGGTCPSGKCASPTSTSTWQDPCGQSDITKRWDGIDCDGSWNILSVNLGYNNLGGVLGDISGLGTTLQNLFLSNNNIAITDLSTLNIQSLTGLKVLGMQSNNIQGAIPGSILGMQNLNQFNIFSNKLNGAFPSSITCAGGAGTCGLQTLRINDNLISGPLSTSLGQLTKLVGFYAYNNKMTGTIPNVFVNMNKLQFIKLQNNLFIGPTIPLWEPLTGSNLLHPDVDVSTNLLDCLLPVEVQYYQHLIDFTANPGFFCNPSVQIVIPPQVTGIGACINVALTSVMPQSAFPSTTTTTTVTIMGSGFNHCLAGWDVRLDGVVQSRGTVTATSVVVTISNPTVNTAAVRYIGIYQAGNTTLISNLVSITFTGVCNAQCVAASGNHISGCDTITGNCQCDPGYGPTNVNAPPFCTNKLCAGSCNHGTCNYSTGTCTCNSGWTGPDCSQTDLSANCPKGGSPLTPCCGNGVCGTSTGLCTCNQINGNPWKTPDCCTRDCPGTPTQCNSGLGHGTCNVTTGVCNCVVNPGGASYSGSACEFAIVACDPVDCYGSDRGHCDTTNGRCVCEPGYGGPPPSLLCNLCDDGYQDVQGVCSRILTCGLTCNEKTGVCNNVTGVCDCLKDSDGVPLYQGAQCGTPKCPLDCSNHGTCGPCLKGNKCKRVNVCTCSSGWTGDDCSKKAKSDNSGAAIGASLAAIGVVALAAGALYAMRRKKINDLKMKSKEMK